MNTSCLSISVSSSVPFISVLRFSADRSFTSLGLFLSILLLLSYCKWDQFTYFFFRNFIIRKVLTIRLRAGLPVHTLCCHPVSLAQVQTVWPPSWNAPVHLPASVWNVDLPFNSVGLQVMLHLPVQPPRGGEMQMKSSLMHQRPCSHWCRSLPEPGSP